MAAWSSQTTSQKKTEEMKLLGCRKGTKVEWTNIGSFIRKACHFSPAKKRNSRVELMEQRLGLIWQDCSSGWWFGNINFIFPLILGCCHHPNWLSIIFFRGVNCPTTNQSLFWLEKIRMSHADGIPMVTTAAGRLPIWYQQKGDAKLSWWWCQCLFLEVSMAMEVPKIDGLWMFMRKNPATNEWFEGSPISGNLHMSIW